MVYSGSYYTLDATKSAYTVSATSSATYTDMKFLLSNNPNNYWQPTSTAGNGLVLDLSATKSINAFGVFINNYDTVNRTGFLVLSGSANGSSWTGIKATHPAGTGRPITMKDLATTESYRYFKLSVLGFSTAPKIGRVFLAQKRSLNKGYSWDNSYTNSIWLNHVQESNNFVDAYPQSLNNITSFCRPYTTVGPIQYATAKTIWDECHGRGNQFVYQEGPNTSDAYLCNMNNDDPSIETLDGDAGLYTWSFTFKSIPYIKENEAI